MRQQDGVSGGDVIELLGMETRSFWRREELLVQDLWQEIGRTVAMGVDNL